MILRDMVSSPRPHADCPVSLFHGTVISNFRFFVNAISEVFMIIAAMHPHDCRACTNSHLGIWRCNNNKQYEPKATYCLLLKDCESASARCNPYYHKYFGYSFFMTNGYVPSVTVPSVTLCHGSMSSMPELRRISSVGSYENVTVSPTLITTAMG